MAYFVTLDNLKVFLEKLKETFVLKGDNDEDDPSNIGSYFTIVDGELCQKINE